MIDIRGGGSVYLHVSDSILSLDPSDNTLNLLTQSTTSLSTVTLHGDVFYGLTKTGELHQFDKGTGTRLGSPVSGVFYEGALFLKSITNDNRPRGIWRKYCETTATASERNITCPVGKETPNTISTILVTLFASTNDRSCPSSESECSVDLTNQVEGQCLGKSTCSISLESVDLGKCTDIEQLVVEVEVECAQGNTACSADICGKGLCLTDNNGTPHCLCDDMHYPGPDGKCTHKKHEVLMSVYSRLALYSSQEIPPEGEQYTFTALRIFAGVGGFSVVSLQGDHVYWWNNETQTISFSNRQAELPQNTILAENVDIESMALDLFGQVWAITRSSPEQAYYDTVSIVTPGFHRKIYSSPGNPAIEYWHVASYYNLTLHLTPHLDSHAHTLTTHLTSPHLTSPHLTSPHLDSPAHNSPQNPTSHPHNLTPSVFICVNSPLRGVSEHAKDLPGRGAVLLRSTELGSSNPLQTCHGSLR
eukprot:sb/3464326/